MDVPEEPLKEASYRVSSFMMCPPLFNRCTDVTFPAYNRRESQARHLMTSISSTFPDSSTPRLLHDD